MNSRLFKLQETRKNLKSEFVGIDSIIDQVMDLITPWYLTPDILERPVVISLWGLTGTGKTSLIRSLVKQLELTGKSMFFDCGEFDNESSFSGKLNDYFDSSQLQENDIRFSDDELKRFGLSFETKSSIPKSDPIDYVFVLDEFQYLNTKDRAGDEKDRQESRAIWSLIDSGQIDMTLRNYRTRSLIEYTEELEIFMESRNTIKIKDGFFYKDLTRDLKQQLSYYRWTEESGEGDLGFSVLQDDDFSYLVRTLNSLKRGLGMTVGDKLKEFTTLADLLEFLKTYVDLISRPKTLNCSKSLVFVLGNLDEAFDLSGEDLDPDIDADVYQEITSRVSVMDIKLALRKRFRDEQVGRLGNNLIIYPSLGRKDFEAILEKEVTRILDKFKTNHGISVSVTPGVKKLLYSEGCFPIQGCRPLFSTINSFISPQLSFILMSGRKDDMVISVSGEDFNTPKVTLFVDTVGGERIGEKEMNLTLGALRSPERCKKLGLQAIHEASHAVLYKILTGKNPSAIVASTIFGDGGYMMDNVSSDFSTSNVWEFRTQVIVSLAGYYGERHFFDSDMCSLGSSSDISNVWDRLSGAFYRGGMLVPIRYAESNVSMENSGLPFGFTDTKEVDKELWGMFLGLCRETQNYIKAEEKLIAKVSEYLLEHRSMGAEVFESLVKEYQKSKVDIPEEDYYKNTIKKYV